MRATLSERFDWRGRRCCKPALPAPAQQAKVRTTQPPTPTRGTRRAWVSCRLTCRRLSGDCTPFAASATGSLSSQCGPTLRLQVFRFAPPRAMHRLSTRTRKTDLPLPQRASLQRIGDNCRAQRPAPTLDPLLLLLAGSARSMAVVAVTGASGAGKDAVVAGERMRLGGRSRLAKLECAPSNFCFGAPLASLPPSQDSPGWQREMQATISRLSQSRRRVARLPWRC